MKFGDERLESDVENQDPLVDSNCEINLYAKQAWSITGRLF